jgi:cystathionine beta-lyase
MLHTELPTMPIARLEGTYLVWVDIRQTGLSSDQLCDQLLNHGHVMMNSGTMYGQDAGEGYIRINIACPRSRMVEGLERMLRELIIEN